MVPNQNTLTIQQALNYYSEELIIQYNSLPLANQTIEALVNCSVCDGLIFEMQNAFNLTTAVGNQLTIIGAIVGAPRNVYGINLTDTFFNFTRYTGVPASVGFNRYTTPVDPDFIARWESTATYTLTDNELRALIYLKIMYNNYYTSLGIIVPALFAIFNGLIDVTDNFNSSITWSFKSPYHNVGSVVAFLGNMVPKPMGISVTYQNI